MALGGLLHRITPDHYNLYDEEEHLVGTIHQLPEGIGPSPTDRWYGRNMKDELNPNKMTTTGLHPTRHHVARELLG